MLEKNEQETFILSERQHVCSELKQNKFRKKHLFYVRYAFSALTLLVEWQEGQLASKKLSGGVLAWLSVWSEGQTCIWPS